MAGGLCPSSGAGQLARGVGGVSDQWPREHSSPVAARAWLESITAAEKRQMRDLMRFHAYVQWIAWTQWQEVRAFAEQADVALMGDVPVGVSIY